jgi:hypothetical protein
MQHANNNIVATTLTQKPKMFASITVSVEEAIAK